MNKKLAVLVLFIIALGAILFLGKASADKEAVRYADAIALQRTELKAIQQENQTAIYSDKLIGGRLETEQEVASIETKCSALSSLASRVKQSQTSATLQTNLFGFLSSDYKEAQNLSGPATNLRLVSDSYSKLVFGCKFYVDSVREAQVQEKVQPLKDALTLAPGSPQCRKRTTVNCLPDQNFAQFKVYFQEDIKLSQATIKRYTSGCAFEELKPICQLILAYVTTRLQLEQAYDAALGSNSGEAVEKASEAFATLAFPREEFCAAAQAITGNQSVNELCTNRANKAVVSKYETMVAAELAKAN